MSWSQLSAADGGVDLGPIDPHAFLETYCLRCHGAEKQKGDRRFDHLGLDIDDDDAAIEWQDILDLINLGEMPPEDEAQPTVIERSGMVGWVTPKLDHYYAAMSQREATGLRRMNRFQYRNTIKDLLGLNMASFDPTASFPSDEKYEGFENIASKLVTSRYHLERYLEAASAAIDKVAEIPAAVPQIDEHYTADDLWKSRTMFRPMVSYFVNIDGKYVEIASGGRDSTSLYPTPFEGVPEDGFYTITVEAEGVGRQNSYDPTLFKMDFAEPIKLQLFANDASVENARSANPSNRKITTIALVDNTPRVYRTRVWLDKGFNFGFRYVNGPFDHRRTMLKVQEKYHPETKTTNFNDVFSKEPSEVLDHYLSDVYEGPRVRIYETSISGPETTDWPPQNYRDLFGEDGVDQLETSAEGLIQDFAQRAFRRPVMDSEIQLYQTFFDESVRSGSSAHTALADTYKAILCSPHFLYIETPLDQSFSDESVTRTDLAQFNLASRLSYFLWGSMPDQELWAAAEAARLSSPIELKYQALRMLRDPRSQAFINDFTDGWLGLSGLERANPDPTKFASFTNLELGKSMREETRAFFSHILRGNRDISEFISANYSFVDRGLAKHYGLPVTGRGDEYERVEFPADSYRGGLLGQAGILTVTANGVDTSPVVRGVWILENILGSPPSPPPPDVPALEPDIRGATSIRDQLAKHRSIETCNECHRKMDPLGFALENFDAIGAFRSAYTDGKHQNFVPVDASGKLPSGERFEDVRGLRSILVARKDQFVRCLTEKLLTYAMGRELSFSDRPQVEAIIEELERRGGGLQDLVEIIVTCDTFRTI